MMKHCDFQVDFPGRISNAKPYLDRARNLLQIAFFVIVIFFVSTYISSQWEKIRDYAFRIDWRVLLAAQIGLIGGMNILSFNAWLLYRDADSNKSPYHTIYRLFFLSSIAKYLPGGVWAFPGRLLLYQRIGLPFKRGMAVISWEIAIMVASAAIVSLLGAPIILELIAPSVVYGFLLFVLIFIVLVTWTVVSGRASRWASSNPLGRKLKSRLFDDVSWLDSYHLKLSLGTMLVCWIAIGSALAGVVYAVTLDSPLSWWPQIVGLFTGAWLVGFLVVIAPGGVGIRDALIVMGLATFLPEPIPLLVAILARVMWTIAELTNLLLSYLIYFVTGEES